MQYKLQPLYSTNQAFNGDVITSDEEKYMGRLYILAADDSKLLNLGIKSEWFLAHASANVLISGHINNEGQWSLSTYRSLEPTLAYTNRNKIFDEIFSPEYICEISYLHEEQTVNISQIISKSDKSDSNKDEYSNITDNKGVTKIVGQLSINPDNIDILRDLILHSSLDELFALSQEIEMPSNHQVEKQQSDFNDKSLTEIMNYFQRESAPKLDEDELFFAQIHLTERVLTEYERQNTNEFVFVPFGTVTVHGEENYFILRDSSDEHTIFTATFDADIIHGLDDVDALQIEMILSQLDTEDYRRSRNISEQEMEVDKAEIKEQRGMEYGA
jgi:hypothetical protein